MALPTYQAAGTGAGGAGDVVPTWPTHQADDIGLLFVESANEVVTAPAGWAAVTSSPQGTGTAAGVNATRLSVFWKRAASGAETNPTVTDAGDHTYAIILTFRGCDTAGNPWNGTPGGDVDATSNTIVSIPGSTTTVTDCLIVLAVAWMTDTTGAQISTYVNTDLANITERTDAGTAAGNGGGVTVITGEKATASAYGATTAVAGTATRQGRMSIALMPPQAPTGTLAVTLGAATSSSAGAVAIAGVETSTLGAATSSSAGAVAIAGASAKTLGALTDSSAGTVAVAGTETSTLGAATSASAGAVAVAGAETSTLGAAAGSGVGTVAIAGALAGTLAGATLGSVGDSGGASVVEDVDSDANDELVSTLLSKLILHRPQLKGLM